MRSRTLFPALIYATVMLGCAVGPDYKRPEVALRTDYIGKQAVQGRSVVPSSQTDIQWWTRFGDPALTELVANALNQNLDIAQAIARVSQARAGLRSADAALLPSAQIDGAGTKQRLSLNTLEGQVFRETPGFDRNTQSFEGDVVVNWEIDLFGGLRRGREAALDEYRAARAGVAAAGLVVAAQVADSYITCRGLQARLAIANEQLKTQQQLVDTIRLRFGKGIAAEFDLHQAEGVLAQVKATIPALQLALDQALNVVDVLEGAQPGTYRDRLSVPGDIPVAPAIADIGGPPDLLRRRPDLIVAEHKLAAANARIGVAISEYFPKISLGGLVGTASTETASLFTGGSLQTQATAGLRWRLFDFGRVDAEIRNAKGQHAEALAAYRLSVLRASEDVEDALSALVNREKQQDTLVAGEQSLVLAQQSSMAAYKGGVVSVIEVLDADTRLLQTRDALAQARTESSRAAVASFRALGGGWEYPERAVAMSRPATQ